MVQIFMPALIAAAIAAGPCVNLHVASKDPLTCLKTNPTLLIIAGDVDGPNPHGPNPNGGDPHDENHRDSRAPGDAHDENHDSHLPANEQQSKYKAPSDPYGGAAN